MDWEDIERRLRLGLLPPKSLLSKARLNDEKDWNFGDINDPKHLPFYYYFGQHLNCSKVYEYGFGLGLVAACFVQGCSTVKKYCGFQLVGNEYYSPRLGRSTLRSYFDGDIEISFGSKNPIQSDQWDIIILSEVVGYNIFWQNLKPEGFLVIDHLEEQKVIFNEFCQIHGREPKIFNTRYGLGIIKR